VQKRISDLLSGDSQEGGGGGCRHGVQAVVPSYELKLLERGERRRDPVLVLHDPRPVEVQMRRELGETIQLEVPLPRFRFLSHGHRQSISAEDHRHVLFPLVLEDAALGGNVSLEVGMPVQMIGVTSRSTATRGRNDSTVSS
jgi:hypothetical protein